MYLFENIIKGISSSKKITTLDKINKEVLITEKQVKVIQFHDVLKYYQTQKIEMKNEKDIIIYYNWYRFLVNLKNIDLRLSQVYNEYKILSLSQIFDMLKLYLNSTKKN